MRLTTMDPPPTIIMSLPGWLFACGHGLDLSRRFTGVLGEGGIAMELLQGEALATRLARGPMPASEAGAVVLAMLAGLDALHREGIVHRERQAGLSLRDPHAPGTLIRLGMRRTAVRNLCKFSLRTASGPEGSSAK